MEPHLIEFAVVVAANDNNPTILNKDFLADQEIVPEEWAWEVLAQLSTPPFATVQYKSDVTITVETNKFTVVDKSEAIDPESSKIKDIAKQYIDVLKHVRYTAVGINFDVFIEIDKTKDFLINRFLKPGSWNSEKHSMEASSFKFVYPLGNGKFNFSFGKGRKSSATPEGVGNREGLLIKTNFHRNCTGYPSSDQVNEYLENVKTDWETCQNTISDLIIGD